MVSQGVHFLPFTTLGARLGASRTNRGKAGFAARAGFDRVAQRQVRCRAVRETGSRTGPAGADGDIHYSSAMRFAACARAGEWDDVSMTSLWWGKNRYLLKRICLFSTLIVMMPGEVHGTVLPGPALWWPADRALFPGCLD